MRTAIERTARPRRRGASETSSTEAGNGYKGCAASYNAMTSGHPRSLCRKRGAVAPSSSCFSRGAVPTPKEAACLSDSRHASTRSWRYGQLHSGTCRAPDIVASCRASEWNGDLPVVALAVLTVAIVLRGLRGTPVTRSVGFLLLSVALVSCSGGSNTDAGQHQSSSATNTTPANTVDRPTPPSHSHSHPGGGEALLSAGAAARVLRGTSDVGVVVAPLARWRSPVLRGLSKPPHAWSTIKPAIAVAVLRARRQGTLPGGRLPTSDERTLIARAIENSDNIAAAALFDELGLDRPRPTRAVSAYSSPRATERHRAQERVTRPPFSSYGQTVWPLDRAALFYRQLANGCLANGIDTGLVLNDMRHVTPSQADRLGVYPKPDSRILPSRPAGARRTEPPLTPPCSTG